MAVIDNLQAYYKVDSGALTTDSHGSFTLTNFNGVTSGTGKINGAASFVYGSAQLLYRNNASDLDFGDADFSFGFWLKATTWTASFAMPLTKDDGSQGAGQSYGFYYDQSGARLYFYVRGGGTYHEIASSIGALSTGTWYYVAGGHNATANDIWISSNAGTPDTTAHSAGVNTGSSGQFMLGSRADQAIVTQYDGLVDEVGVWGRDIRSDLAALYNGGAGLAYPLSAPSATRTSRLALLGVS